MAQYSDTMQTISGYPVGDWRLFLDRGYLRYLRVFYRNENKKRFFHMHWPAFFCPFHWSFYRKLYLRGTVLMLLEFLMIFLLYLGGGALCRDRIVAAQREVDFTRPGYQAAEMMLNTDFPQLTPDIAAKIEAYQAANRSLARERGIRTAIWFVPVLLLHLWSGLTADCHYRNRGLRCKLQDDADVFGVSVSMLVVAVFISLVGTFLLQKLLAIFPHLTI